MTSKGKDDICRAAKNTRTPTAVTKEPDDKTLTVKLVMNGILPPTFGDRGKPKNGSISVKFYHWGLDVNALIQVSPTETTHWKYVVKKLPAEINVNTSTYKVKKDLVELNLVKKDPKSWVAMLTSGLEQEESSSDEG